MLTDFLGETTTIGLYQTFFDETRRGILEKIAIHPTYIYTDETLNDLNDVEFEYDIKPNHGIVTSIEKDKVNIFKINTDRGDINDTIHATIIKTPNPAAIVSDIIITLESDNDKDRDVAVDDIFQILKYGISKLEKSLKKRISSLFSDSLVDDKYMVAVKSVTITSSNEKFNDPDGNVTLFPLIITYRIHIVNEELVRVGGSEYVEAKQRHYTKINK